MRPLKISKQITNRESQSLDKYFQEIGKVHLVTAEVEAELTKRIRDGDPIALEKLTVANLRFVVSVAKQYQNGGLTLGDLINEGNFGLIRAAKRFDEKRGFKFISYAVWWIRQAIVQALNDQSRIVRLPSNRIGSLAKITKTFAELEQTHQREPTTQELADVVGITADEILNNLKNSGGHVSIDAPFVTGEDNNLLDVLVDSNQSSPESAMMAQSLVKEVQRSLSRLTLREADVLNLYFGLNQNAAHTLEEIGHKFHITRQRVLQIKDKATWRLRNTSENQMLKSYLG